jgi:hypothetical protein
VDVVLNVDEKVVSWSMRLPDDHLRLFGTSEVDAVRLRPITEKISA